MGKPLPKPEPRAKVKARARRDKAAKRLACVEAVWKRDGYRCQRCLAPVVPPSLGLPQRCTGHVHEHLHRSQGGDPTDPDNCILLCGVCHMRAHGLRAT